MNISTVWSCQSAAEIKQLMWASLGDSEPQREHSWAGFLIWEEQNSEGTEGRSRTLRGQRVWSSFPAAATQLWESPSGSFSL